MGAAWTWERSERAAGGLVSLDIQHRTSDARLQCPGFRASSPDPLSPLALFDLVQLDEQAKDGLHEVGVDVEALGVGARALHDGLLL